MNINDIWNGFLAIYNRVSPALLIMLAGIIAVTLSCRGISVRSTVVSRLSSISKSQWLSDFGNTVEHLRIGALIPLIIVILLFAYLVVLGDTASWITAIVPTPLEASYTPWDIVAEQRAADDLAFLGTTLASPEGIKYAEIPPDTATARSSDLYAIYRYYERQRQRLQNKYPERFRTASELSSSELSSLQSLYGGFLLLTCLFFAQLILRKARPNWLWYSRTTFLRTILVISILFFLTARYRLHWEWATERNVSSQVRITTDILREESNLTNLDSLQSIKQQIEMAQRQFKPHHFWLARYYDRVSMRLWNVSHRQLN